jgi:hypothetical protein
MMVRILIADLADMTNVVTAYGDMNLFCSCGPTEQSLTGMEAPMPT